MVQQSMRTDKWQIVATQEQKELLRNTVCEFRLLVKSLKSFSEDSSTTGNQIHSL